MALPYALFGAGRRRRSRCPGKRRRPTAAIIVRRHLGDSRQALLALSDHENALPIFVASGNSKRDWLSGLIVLGGLELDQCQRACRSRGGVGYFPHYLAAFAAAAVIVLLLRSDGTTWGLGLAVDLGRSRHCSS